MIKKIFKDKPSMYTWISEQPRGSREILQVLSEKMNTQQEGVWTVYLDVNAGEPHSSKLMHSYASHTIDFQVYG